MGCGTSHDASSTTKSQNPTTQSYAPRSSASQQHRCSSVSFTGESQLGEPDATRHDSLRHAESFGSLGGLGSVSATTYPHQDMTYATLSEDMKQALYIIAQALDTNERECERARREMHDKRERDAALKAREVPQGPQVDFRGRTKSQPPGAAFDRPPTPTGYYAEEPSATAVKVQNMMSKFADFFSGGRPADAAADSESTNVTAKAPHVKYTTEVSDAGMGGSMYQASLGFVSANGSMASAGTRASYLGINGDEPPVDEKVLVRVGLWATDHVAVVLRVAELVRRRMVAPDTAGLEVANDHTDTSAADNGSDRQGTPPSTDGATTESVATSHSSLAKVFVPTISADPLAQMLEDTSPAVPEHSDGKDITKSKTPEGSSSTTPQVSTRRAFGAASGWSRQDNFLTKRNLDKLQERLAMAEATGISQLSKIDMLADSGHQDAKVPRDAALVSCAVEQDITGSEVTMRKRTTSRCEDALLFQELV